VSALEYGFQKSEIERSAYRIAQETDSGERVGGVNRSQLDEEEPYEPLRGDLAIEAQQAERLTKLRAERDQSAVDAARSELKKAAEGTDNVLSPTRLALKSRATLGEVCNALREVWELTCRRTPSERVVFFAGRLQEPGRGPVRRSRRLAGPLVWEVRMFGPGMPRPRKPELPGPVEPPELDPLEGPPDGFEPVEWPEPVPYSSGALAAAEEFLTSEIRRPTDRDLLARWVYEPLQPANESKVMAKVLGRLKAAASDRGDEEFSLQDARDAVKDLAIRIHEFKASGDDSGSGVIVVACPLKEGPLPEELERRTDDLSQKAAAWATPAISSVRDDSEAAAVQAASAAWRNERPHMRRCCGS
jgi:hypothetical protein